MYAEGYEITWYRGNFSEVSFMMNRNQIELIAP